MFDQDPKKSIRLIEELTIGTLAESWKKQVDCGRVAMNKLRQQYYGKSKGEKRKHTGKGVAQ